MTNINIIPQVKEYRPADGVLNLTKISWTFCDELDTRVKNEALRIAADVPNGVPVSITAGNSQSESYTIKIRSDSAEIISDSARGAFYALQSLKCMIRNNSTVNCCEIHDEPDMAFRGFYHDVTRGKVPKLDTLKKLADTMAEYKLNMMQLYIEHTYEFAEFASVKDKFGYLSKSEIKELDMYCRDRFIDLVPSIPTFGHLYELLMTNEHKHLSELPDFEPRRHYFIERMLHHTINPELPESFEVVKRLIDQYLEVSSSDKFNICCDETFDLGNGVNKGKNKAELYVGFVKKLIAYLQSKGKTVMMWGDIILQHPEAIGDLPDDVIFLNWDYDADVKEDKFKTMGDFGKTQLVCPGTNAWNAFTEAINTEELNIGRVCEYGYKNNALGILNTNWGDNGHMCDISMSMYGLICGAAAGWRRETKFDQIFRKNVSVLQYGDDTVIDILAEISCERVLEAANWYIPLEFQGKLDKRELDEKCAAYKQKLPSIDFDAVYKRLDTAKSRILRTKFYNEDVKTTMLNSLEGYALLAKWCAAYFGIKTDCGVNYSKWRECFSSIWLEKNKESELNSVLQVFDNAENNSAAL